ncbi:MAG TPA: hypothetical protein VGA15_08860 [Bradyrhizobium sp.]
MMRLKVETTGKGLHTSEVVVKVKTSSGVERLVVSERAIDNNEISIGWPIRTKDDLYLIELPNETQSGAWRVWVNRDQVSEPQPQRVRA